MENIKNDESIKNSTPYISKTLLEIFSEIKGKIKEDLIRFRTCCADPRGSK